MISLYLQEKAAVQEYLFNKVVGLIVWKFMKKRLQHRFFLEYCKICRNCFFYRTPSVAASVGLTGFLTRLCFYSEAVVQRCSVKKVFCEKGVVRNFAKFTGKYLYRSLCFNNVVGLRPATLLKKRLWHRCFPVNFVKFLRMPSLTEHLRWLLLFIAEFEKVLVDRHCKNKKRCRSYALQMI